MPWTIESLRSAIVVVAAVLLLAIFGFIVYGRWRLRHIAQDLPARLGIQVQQTTQGLVLSQSNDQGRTIFTLHAARAVQFKSGKRVALHDVEIDLYNQPKGKADTIAGKDFEYDPRNRIVASQGETHIVLYPSKNGSMARGKNADQPIRVTTHGLIFDQKTGVATCSGEVDFQVAGSSGQAVGARYDSRQGRLLLRSQVALTTLVQNRPALLHASQAIYDRNSGEVHLRQPNYSAAGQHGTERADADAAVVYLRSDNSAERLDAEGRVRLTSGTGTTIQATTLQGDLNEHSQPTRMHFSGGVQLAQNQNGQQTSGVAQEAVVDFDDQGRANQAVFDRDVEFQQQMEENKRHLFRTLASRHLVMLLAPAKTGQAAQLHSAEAAGNAVFTSQSIATGSPAQKTRLAAQNLSANFLAGNQLQTMNGTGQTQIQMVAANGDIDMSSGDKLKVDFNPGAEAVKGGGPAPPSSQALMAGTPGTRAPQSIRTAVQTGHVVLQQIGKAKTAGSPAQILSTTTAARADYIGSTETLTLAGRPVFRNPQLEMTAKQIVVQHASGTAVLTGAVQATLHPSGSFRSSPGGGLLGGNQPVHVIARQATLLHEAERAVFTGRARLWQGGDSVEAHAIELSQKMQTMTAHGSQTCSQCVISNLLGQTASSSGNSPNTQSGARRGEPATFHILSGRLLYSDAERKITFLNHVQVISSDGQLSADHAEVFLTPASHRPARPAVAAEKNNSSLSRNNSAQSSVERIVATGHIQIVQPGRHGTGTRLVYTASDGKFVLTGDGEHPPEIFDVDHGTVTGQMLTFSSPEQAIIVNGSSSRETTTRTRVHKN